MTRTYLKKDQLNSTISGPFSREFSFCKQELFSSLFSWILEFFICRSSILLYQTRNLITRFSLLVCTSSPLGLGNTRLPDENFNASSSVEPYKPSDARLGSNTSWVSEGAQEFLQIRFQPYPKLVTGVATQGNPHHYWFVTLYNLLYSSDGVMWLYYEHEGQPGSRKVKVSVISGNLW